MGRKRITTEEFIKRAKSIHGDKYDYSSTEFINSKTKLKIICPKHGGFLQLPFTHLQGCGCKECKREKLSSSQTMTTDDFIKKAKNVHGDKYDYSKAVYKGSHEKILIICPEHGEFLQTSCDHLTGYGCPKCGTKKSWNSRGRITTEDFIEKARKIHGDKYDYSKVKYTKNRDILEIICHKKYRNGLEHGTFYQKANAHLTGHGCPHCRNSRLETLMHKLLSENNVIFEKEKTYDWLVKNGHLYLDYFLPEYNVAIECQGIQHYADIKICGRKGYKYIHERDLLKKKLCEEHNIKILYFTEKCIYENYCENKELTFYDFNSMLEEIKNE